MEEYLDILDENGKMTGKSASREEIHSRGFWHRTAQVLLMNTKNEIFIHRRAKNKKYYPGMWDIYFGGHVLRGENSQQALRREVEEEINLLLDSNDFQFLFDIKKSDLQNGGSFANNDFAEIFLVKKDFDQDRLVLQKEEISETKFIPLAQLKRMIGQDDENFIPREKEYDLLFDSLEKK